MINEWKCQTLQKEANQRHDAFDVCTKCKQIALNAMKIDMTIWKRLSFFLCNHITNADQPSDLFEIFVYDNWKLSIHFHNAASDMKSD